MIDRIIRFPEKSSFFLFGPRQTGKSTVIRERFQKDIFLIDLAQQETFSHYAKDPAVFRKDILKQAQMYGVTTFFVDEVQRIPDVLNDVHSLIESHALRFILTGSSARKLKRGGANLLAGRAYLRHLHPCVYEEIKNSFFLEDVLKYGALPAVLTQSPEEKVEFLKVYTQTYLREEIKAESIVRHIGNFTRFLDVAAAQSGEILSFSEIARECQVSPNTAQSYYQILEDTLIGFILWPYRKSVRKQLSGQPKFYFFDCGVLNSINHRLQEDPDPVYRGRLFEHFIILETHRMQSYLQSETQLFFWRTQQKKEVDLLIEKHGRLFAAIEIKSATHLNRHDLGGLLTFKAEHPDVPCMLVATISNPTEIQGITCLPYVEYFKWLKENLV